MWILGKVDEFYLQGQVDRNRINIEERDMILSTPQIKLVSHREDKAK